VPLQQFRVAPHARVRERRFSVPEWESRCGLGIKRGDANIPLVQYGLVDRKARHAVQFHQIFLEHKCKKQMSRLWFKKTVDTSSSSTVPALLWTLLTTGGLVGGFVAVVRQHVLKVLGPEGHAKT
jgi:hypothetical protein